MASTDRHTVKPWFQGKVDVAPNVVDLTDAGFPLLGGRTERIGGESVPVLVYSIRKHVVDMFVLRQPISAKDLDRSMNGFHFAAFDFDGLHYVVVTDATTKELDEFVKASEDRNARD